MSRKATSTFNIPGITPTLYLVIQGGSTGMNNVFGLPPGTTRWPLHKDHSRNTKVMKISKLWHEFKISPILADLCLMSLNISSRHSMRLSAYPRSPAVFYSGASWLCSYYRLYSVHTTLSINLITIAIAIHLFYFILNLLSVQLI